MLLEKPITAIKHHYCYINVRWECRRELKDVHAEEEHCGGREPLKGRGFAAGDPGSAEVLT